MSIIGPLSLALGNFPFPPLKNFQPPPVAFFSPTPSSSLFSPRQQHGARALFPHGRELSPPAARRPLLLLPRAGQQLVHLSLPWRFPCEQRSSSSSTSSRAPPCPPPSASSLLIAPRAAEVSGAFFPSSTFPRALSPWPSSPRLPWPSAPASSAHPFSHSNSLEGSSTPAQAFPMAPPFAHSLPAPFLPLASNGTAPPCSYSLARQQLPWRPENSSWLPSSSSPISSSSQQAIPSAVQSAASFSRPCQQHAMAGSAPSMGVPCCSLRPALSIQHAPFSSMEKPAASPLLAVLRGARRLFDKLCSKPHAAGSLFGGANGQHAVMPPSVRCFCAAPNIDVVHPGETATLLVWFRIDVIFIRLIVYVCCFIFVEERTPCFARRREAARRLSMFVAMHK
eukprot:XP_020398565.1 vegetative cell wall protein gp1-like [Zea mays]